MSVIPIYLHTLGQWRTHNHPAHAGGSGEMRLARLSPAGVQAVVHLRHGNGPDAKLCGMLKKCRLAANDTVLQFTISKRALAVEFHQSWQL